MPAPAQTCCGCFTLLCGVESICLLHLIFQILVIAVTESDTVLNIGGVKIPPGTQVLNGAWSVIGIPIVICAGVGAVYRVEMNLRVYLYYIIATCIFTLLYFVSMLFVGDICSAMVSPDLQRLGSSMVCGFSDAIAVFWMLLLSFIWLYAAFTVWSAAEQLSRVFSGEETLLAHKRKLLQQVGAPIVGGVKGRKF